MLDHSLANALSSRTRFQLGRCVMTRGAALAMRADPTLPLALLDRHSTGDWGDIDPEDRDANEKALARGLRLLSAYCLAGGVRVWVITEADRRITTILLPEEY